LRKTGDELRKWKRKLRSNLGAGGGEKTKRKTTQRVWKGTQSGKKKKTGDFGPSGKKPGKKQEKSRGKGRTKRRVKLIS